MANPILIIGAGMGGLTAGLAMLQRGIDVAIYEDAPELGEVGAGLSIQASTRLVIESLGLIEALADEVVTLSGIGRRHYQTGELLTLQDFGENDWRTGGPHAWVMHRADLHSALVAAIQAIDPECIHLGHRFTGFTQDEGGVEARFANGVSAKGAALVGADGLRSTTRAALFGADNPRYGGIVSWRGLVPMDRIRPGLVTPESCRWIGPDWRFQVYPVHHGTLMNYIASVANQTWQIESWKEHSEIADALAMFEGGDPTILEIIAATPPELCFKWALFDRDPLERWTVGRATLLGDAAHPLLPFLGAGAGLAMEDGVVLARCLKHDADIPAAFERYEGLRKARATASQLAARENGRWPFDQRFANDASATAAKDWADHPAAYDAATVALE